MHYRLYCTRSFSIWRPRYFVFWYTRTQHMQCTNMRWLFASAHFEPIKFHQKQQIDFKRSTVPNADLYSIIALHFRFLSFSPFLSRSPPHFMSIRFDCDDDAVTRFARSANDSHPIMVSPTESPQYFRALHTRISRWILSLKHFSSRKRHVTHLEQKNLCCSE